MKLPEFVHASSESPSASDWEREAVGKYREMASWIEQHMSVKEGPSTLTSEDNHLQQLLVSAVHEEASKRVAKVCFHRLLVLDYRRVVLCSWFTMVLHSFR